MNREYEIAGTRSPIMLADQENPSQGDSPVSRGAKAAAITIAVETAKGAAKGVVEEVQEALKDTEAQGAERIIYVFKKGASGAATGAKNGFKTGLKEAPVVFAGVVVKDWLEEVLGGNASVSFRPVRRMAMSTVST